VNDALNYRKKSRLHRLSLAKMTTDFRISGLRYERSQRWKTKLWSGRGRAELEKLALAPWASRRRQELLELLDRVVPIIEELTWLGRGLAPCSVGSA
jgi:hypothetical protein